MHAGSAACVHPSFLHPRQHPISDHRTVFHIAGLTVIPPNRRTDSSSSMGFCTPCPAKRRVLNSPAAPLVNSWIARSMVRWSPLVRRVTVEPKLLQQGRHIGSIIDGIAQGAVRIGGIANHEGELSLDSCDRSGNC